MNTNPEYIDYDDTEVLKQRLFGRKITQISREGERGSYFERINFTLDDGSVLQAQARDGGCACSNGCFTVDIPEGADGELTLLVGGTILNVEVEETTTDFHYDQETGEGTHSERKVEPGSIHDGSATIRLFIYTDLDPHGRFTLVESEGGDNGYYGWGFNFVFTPAVTA